MVGDRNSWPNDTPPRSNAPQDNLAAGHALRGFRLQILYTLSRLIALQGRADASLWPEGVEDVALHDAGGVLQEAVQVKAHTAPLTLSDLLSKHGRSLLHRAVDTLRQHPHVRVKLVSFGPIGAELEAAWAGDLDSRRRVQGKLKHAGLAGDEIERLFQRFEFERIQEHEVTGQIRDFFRAHPVLCGEAEPAIDLVCHWLFGAAERRSLVTYADLVARLDRIGRFLQERAAHRQEWLATIQSLEDDRDDPFERERRAQEFRQGMAADYRHILAGCDVTRPQWLTRIEEAFAETPVVILRGASGQGKSTLAYRYLHDCTPSLWRFQIRAVEGRQHALQIAAALSGHARAIGAPMILYLDVKPEDRGWPELVRELARLPLVRVLVTIREEDWRRTTLSGAMLEYREIPLELDRTEAVSIYQGLERDRNSPFLDFDEAWQRFGGNGPLLEFVFLVTRSTTLRECLYAQLTTLRDEVRTGRLSASELRLLAMTVFASSLGARLDLAATRQYLALPDLGRTLERMEREYLLRRTEGGARLEGLHPLRSQVLAELLCDGNTFEAMELAKECLPLLPSGDVEGFLLQLAIRHAGQMSEIEQHLWRWQPPSWTACGGVFRALLWWGVRRYLDLGAPLIDEMKIQFPDAWWMILGFDLAGIMNPSDSPFWRTLGFVPEENKARFQGYLDRMPDGVAAFEPLRVWLPHLMGPPSAPVLDTDWAAIAQMSYWCGHIPLNAPLREWLAAPSLDEALDRLPLDLLAQLLTGRWELCGEDFTPWLQRHHDRIAARFRRETDTVWLEEENGVVRAHFLIGMSRLDESNGSHPGPEDDSRKGSILHAEAIQRVTLLRGLFPNLSGFGCQGYGHRILPLPFDDTTKTAIKPEILPPDWASGLNATAIALVKWAQRPDDWDGFIKAIWAHREAMVQVFSALHRALTAHFRDRRKEKALGKRIDTGPWGALRDASGKPTPLPKQAVDPWGFVSDGRCQGSCRVSWQRILSCRPPCEQVFPG